MLRLFTVLSLCFVFISPASAEAIESEEWLGKAFTIEDSRCYVGIAKVVLSVSELTQEDGYLVGDYVLDVPMVKSKSDHGRIKLPVEETFEELKKNGGVLKGNAYSGVVEGKINKVVCEIVPEENQAIRLAITTDHRTINFISRYTIIEKPVVETDQG
ncbi:MAG: hypothetical protein AAGC73_04355 [Verrucomicrobiota bacterium]